MGIRAGLLREKVTILKPVVTRNDYGDEVTTWEQVCTTRARVDFRSGTRAVEANEVVNPYTVTFVIRRFPQLSGYMRLSWHGNLYAIESINSEDHKQQQTIIASVINE
jgi:SPP1 family predicted phage head-tail adaptor